MKESKREKEIKRVLTVRIIKGSKLRGKDKVYRINL